MATKSYVVFKKMYTLPNDDWGGPKTSVLVIASQMCMHIHILWDKVICTSMWDNALSQIYDKY